MHQHPGPGGLWAGKDSAGVGANSAWGGGQGGLCRGLAGASPWTESVFRRSFLLIEQGLASGERQLAARAFKEGKEEESRIGALKRLEDL